MNHFIVYKIELWFVRHEPWRLDFELPYLRYFKNHFLGSLNSDQRKSDTSIGKITPWFVSHEPHHWKLKPSFVSTLFTLMLWCAHESFHCL